MGLAHLINVVLPHLFWGCLMRSVVNTASNNFAGIAGKVVFGVINAVVNGKQLPHGQGRDSRDLCERDRREPGRLQGSYRLDTIVRTTLALWQLARTATMRPVMMPAYAVCGTTKDTSA